MLALRSVLAIPLADTAAIAAARGSGADAVLLDLAVPASHPERTGSRAIVGEAIEAIGATGRPVLVRLASASSGELEADIAAAVGPRLAAVVLSATELPQDTRDADVLLRKYEMRHNITPGAVRLIPEIDSAVGLQALPTILEAVDRHTAVALNLARLHGSLGLGSRSRAPHDHLMAAVALAARAADLPWLLGSFDAARVRTEAPHAHEFGAAGAIIHSEASARGLNSLFTPDPGVVAAARTTLDAWATLRATGKLSGVVSHDGHALPVDRRAMRHARLVIARADAIATRERVK